ncbi:MAG TPA: CHRD domain-containing protein, partial [Chitinophagaceae bacterium]|nr:CHRD domain-containing protein [Chitinophagaceae bacterium]
FSGPGASGKVTGLRQGQIDTLLTMPVYINVHSTQQPAGIVRSALDKTVDFAMDIPLSGNNEVGPVTTTATGLAILRIAGDSLISKVTVTGVEANDTLTVSHIHRGAIGVNGPVRVFLASSLADFGITKITFLPDSMDTMVKTEACYVNVHSRRNPPGKIRGPIR